jgi:hypothetical protein
VVSIPDDDPRETRLDRAASYWRVGERVVGACEFLIAVWDGRPARGVGGSADVVEQALKDGRTVIWIQSEQPADPPRIVRAVTYDEAGQLATEATSEFPSTLRSLSTGYYQHTSYCRDTAVASQACEAAIEEARSALLRTAARAGLARGDVEPALMAILPHLVRADALARYYQRRHTWVAHGVLYLAAAGVTVAVTQVLFFPRDSWIVAFEVLAMAGVFALWRFGRREEWHQKWLHDRYLSERLRVALFTTLSGAGSEPSRDESLPFYHGPQHWLLLAPTTLSRSVRLPAGFTPFEPLKRFIVEAWLHDQRRFHLANAAGKSKHQRRRHVLGFGLFGLTLLMALVHLFGSHNTEAERSTVLRGDLWVIFLALVLPVWAGVVHSITSQMELERIAERSGRMAKVLERFADRALAARTPDEFQKTCVEAGDMMTIETHEWWVLLSFQGVTLHV